MTFEEFYSDIELQTYNKTEYECMKMAWNAAIAAAQVVLKGHDFYQVAYATDYYEAHPSTYLEALKTKETE